MRVTLLPLLLLSIGARLPAQESAEGWLIPFACAYQPAIEPFNLRFAQHNLPEAGLRHYGWGVELRSVSGHFLFGPLFFRTWDDAENDIFQLRTEATALFGELGLNIAPLRFLNIVPLIGLGGLSQSFSLRKRTGDLNLDSLLAAPGQVALIASGMKATGLAALELGLSYPTKQASYGVALRAGYLYSPFLPTWHLPNGSDVTDTPRTRLGGPFFSIGLLLIPRTEMSSFSPYE
ncbi:MAG: hypothetical protein ABIK44_00500 [candidate division WOR-3 bacterium]